MPVDRGRHPHGSGGGRVEVTPTRLTAHLEKDHDVDWADVMDADEMNRVHDHHYRQGFAHVHEWAGKVADPQPPLSSGTPG